MNMYVSIAIHGCGVVLEENRMEEECWIVKAMSVCV